MGSACGKIGDVQVKPVTRDGTLEVTATQRYVDKLSLLAKGYVHDVRDAMPSLLEVALRQPHIESIFTSIRIFFARAEQASFNHVLVLRLAQQVQAVAESLDHAYKATHDVRGSDYVTVDVASADAIGAVKAAIDKASDIASVFGDSGCIVRVLMAPVYNSQAREVCDGLRDARLELQKQLLAYMADTLAPPPATSQRFENDIAAWDEDIVAGHGDFLQALQTTDAQGDRVRGILFGTIQAKTGGVFGFGARDKVLVSVTASSGGAPPPEGRAEQPALLARFKDLLNDKKGKSNLAKSLGLTATDVDIMQDTVGLMTERETEKLELLQFRGTRDNQGRKRVCKDKFMMAPVGSGGWRRNCQAWVPFYIKGGEPCSAHPCEFATRFRVETSEHEGAFFVCNTHLASHFDAYANKRVAELKVDTLSFA